MTDNGTGQFSVTPLETGESKSLLEFVRFSAAFKAISGKDNSRNWGPKEES